MEQTEKREQEQLFCVYMARGFSPEEAARRAYADLDPEMCSWHGTQLLANGRIRARIRRLSRELDFCSPSNLAKAGLTRIALGDPSGVFSLLDEDSQLPVGAELLGIAEMKRTKGGGAELKFFDRIRALSALAEMDGGRSEGVGTLLDALARSARGIDEALPELDEDERGSGRKGAFEGDGGSDRGSANDSKRGSGSGEVGEVGGD